MPGESDKWGWKHVSVYGGFDKGSGTKRWKCNHCNVRYNGSYSRVRAHLLGFTGVGVKGCPAIDRSLREAFQALEEDRVTRKKKKPTTASGKPPGKRVKTLQLNSTAALRTLSKEDVDDTVSRFFYADSLNLNTINSYYFQDMAKALASFGPGYELPSREQLAGPSLNKEKARIERSFNLVKESWPHTGCTILCVNRLDSSLGCFCINFFISSPRGVMFLKTIDINEGDGADSLFISVLSDTIIEAGPTNVLQVITHLGQASSAFESIIMTKFPNVFWSHCTSHSIYVLMEEIAEIEWMKTTLSCARGIEQIVLSYQRTSSSIIFDNQKDCSNHHHIGLKFAPCYLLVQKMFDIQLKLRELVGSEEWKQWKLTVPTDDCMTTIEAALLGDEFWNKVELMIQLYEPFITSLSFLDIDKSVMGDIYNWRVQSLETLRCKGIDNTSVNELEMVIETKWDMLFSPLHAAGYMLNPRYFGKGQTKDKNVMRGWKATLDRYESDSGARRTLREQLSFFWRMEGSLGEEDAVECRDKMDPVAWWENFGFEIPQLQTLAIRVLSQVCSVSICQDGWKCNTLPCKQSVCKLGVEKTEDLVFVQNNLRLQSQKSGNPSCLFGSRNGTMSCGSIIAT